MTLSIITPTYNRADYLPRCYNSLRGQTSCDFEWIIVDDGSTDNTEAVVSAFSSELFPIVYVKKPNGGKHTALNASIPYIHGKNVLILDSDDYLLEYAVEKVISAWETYGKNPEIGVITFLRGTDANHAFAYVEEEGVPLDLFHHKRTVLIGNDCCETFLSDLFRANPFPVFENERFLSEGVLWKAIGRTHKCLYFNQIIYICEYLEGGLTKQGRKLRILNPKGGMLNASLSMEKDNYFSTRIKNGLLYDCYGFFAGVKPKSILFEQKNNLIIKASCLFPGYLLFRYWRRKYQND